jgi:Na+/phosphate symporter
LVYRLKGSELADDGEYYFQMLDYLAEAAHCVFYITEPSFNHIDDNHGPLHPADAGDLKDFIHEATRYINKVQQSIASGKTPREEKEIANISELYDSLAKMRKNHLKRFKSGSISGSVSLLYLDILSESKNLISLISRMSVTSKALTR